ncbi:hypothetical protein J4206_02760 [Candidatus Woesearchaeota archaeon]|nr:hypothetical protein [Candidatus Woesearchaeota archaeon]
MGDLRVIFEIKDSTIYGSLDSQGLLNKDSKPTSYNGVRGITVRSFSADALNWHLARLIFASDHYEAIVRDPSSKEVGIESRFGPAHIFGIGLNSHDGRYLDEWLKTAFAKIERYIPMFRKHLSYVGTSMRDYDCMSPNSFRGDMEKLLSQ